MHLSWILMKYAYGNRFPYVLCMRLQESILSQPASQPISRSVF